MGKTKKELGLDSMGIQKTMRLTDYLGDGLGQLPLNIMSSLVGQLTYFYTEKVGLAAGMVATMLLIAKIFDAFFRSCNGKNHGCRQISKRKMSSLVFKNGNSCTRINHFTVYRT